MTYIVTFNLGLFTVADPEFLGGGELFVKSRGINW